jgi:hypothetical protein
MQLEERRDAGKESKNYPPASASGSQWNCERWHRWSALGQRRRPGCIPVRSGIDATRCAGKTEWSVESVKEEEMKGEGRVWVIRVLKSWVQRMRGECLWRVENEIPQAPVRQVLAGGRQDQASPGYHGDGQGSDCRRCSPSSVITACR